MMLHPVGVRHQDFVPGQHTGHHGDMAVAQPGCAGEDDDRADFRRATPVIAPRGVPPPIGGVAAQIDPAQRAGERDALQRHALPRMALLWRATAGGQDKHQHQTEKHRESAHETLTRREGADGERGTCQKQVRPHADFRGKPNSV